MPAFSKAERRPLLTLALHKSPLGQQPVINVRRRNQRSIYSNTLLYGEPFVGWYPHSHTGLDACHRDTWYASVVHTCRPNEPHARPRKPGQRASPTDCQRHNPPRCGRNQPRQDFWCAKASGAGDDTGKFDGIVTWASWLEIIFCIAGEYPTNLSVAGRSAACMCSSFCVLDIFICQHSDSARVTALCSSGLPFRETLVAATTA
jgi:hypothetical protein